MTGTETGGPVVAGTRFLAVAEAYVPIEETEGGQLSDISKLDQRSETVVSKDTRRSISENGAHYTDPDAIRGTLFPSVCFCAPVTEWGKRTG